MAGMLYELEAVAHGTVVHEFGTAATVRALAEYLKRVYRVDALVTQVGSMKPEVSR